MTIEDAVAILNREKHNGHRWIVETSWDGTERYAECGGDAFEDRSEFEAIAIAEKYERDGAESEGDRMKAFIAAAHRHLYGGIA